MKLYLESVKPHYRALVIPAKAGIQKEIMKLRNFYTYILASGKNGMLYIGVTNDLLKRVQQHKSKEVKGFTEKYNVNKLVYFEVHDTAESAIIREKNMKKWKREWKIKLIEKGNPGWRDLSDDF